LKRALIVWGGWEGHEPEPIARWFGSLLEDMGMEVRLENSLEVLRHRDLLFEQSLIVPVWTMGTIHPDEIASLDEAVQRGVGLGGCHGGMCDAFRDCPDYQFMTGGQWVAHPGNDGVTYDVRIIRPDHPVTAGVPDFTVTSEHYYLHVDPSNTVLAVTPMPVAGGPHVTNGSFDMPVVWVRLHGQGRVFYISLGHTLATLQNPEPSAICRNGLAWAARIEPL